MRVTKKKRTDIEDECAHRGRVCVRVLKNGECACVLWASVLYCVILKKRRIGNST